MPDESAGTDTYSGDLLLTPPYYDVQIEMPRRPPRKVRRFAAFRTHSHADEGHTAEEAASPPVVSTRLNWLWSL